MRLFVPFPIVQAKAEKKVAAPAAAKAAPAKKPAAKKATAAKKTVSSIERACKDTAMRILTFDRSAFADDREEARCYCCYQGERRLVYLRPATMRSDIRLRSDLAEGTCCQDGIQHHGQGYQARGEEGSCEDCRKSSGCEEGSGGERCTDRISALCCADAQSLCLPASLQPKKK